MMNEIKETPLQTAGFDEPLYCECGQELEEGQFNPEHDLKHGCYFTSCQCGENYRIDLREKTNACKMDVIFKLWQDYEGVFPALVKELYLDD